MGDDIGLSLVAKDTGAKADFQRGTAHDAEIDSVLSAKHSC